MKYAAIALLLLSPGLLAQEEEAADHVRLLNDLTAANSAEDVVKIQTLLGPIAEVGKSAKEASVVDGLAKELVNSYGVCKGNWGTLSKILATLGELRSKQSARFLKRLASRKKAETAYEEEIQAAALTALSMLRDPKYISTIEDQTKNMKSVIVAKAAYESFKNYGPAKGKIRKKIAELLMKRLQAEEPSSAGGKTSDAQRERWKQLSLPIVAAMQAVCREDTIVDVENWAEWWSENKRSSAAWKDPKPGS